MTNESPRIRRRYLLGGLFVLALFWTVWASLTPQGALPAVDFPDKLAHALNYALLAFLLSALQKRLPAWGVVLCVTAFGGLIELAQMQTGYRHAEWLDMLANLVGAIAGCVAWRLLRR